MAAHLNTAHPFREGNGRTVRVMLEQLAERTPFGLDWDRISAEEWNQASAAMMPWGRGEAPDPTAMVPVFRGLTVDRTSSPTPEESTPERAHTRTAAQLAAMATPRRQHPSSTRSARDGALLREQAGRVTRTPETDLGRSPGV